MKVIKSNALYFPVTLILKNVMPLLIAYVQRSPNEFCEEKVYIVHAIEE